MMIEIYRSIAERVKKPSREFEVASLLREKIDGESSPQRPKVKGILSLLPFRKPKT